ncbi:FAD-dependent monooxygenase [Microbacterium terrisoli]|uniref:FAD-dependent monooxygenase n=1 Tax=Microbacterium terrisoli TaxID=3242192 RepID=UPI002806214D|nr:FAD-dependent monooxygenase [Microbacterium protaetiae]
MANHTVRVAIIGAGIGGLAAAIALTRIAGVQVTVFEQARHIAEVGAGFGVAPNGQRVLDRLGLLDETKLAGAVMEGPDLYRNADSRIIAEGAYSDSSGRYHTLGMHRADFVDMLTRQLPSGTVHTGHRLTSIRASDTSVRLEFENGTDAEFDAVVGADGIHSVVRESITQPSNPVYSGSIAYRGVLDASLLPKDWPMKIQIWMGKDKHFMCYPLRHRTLFNYVGFVSSDKPLKESWSAAGDVDELAAEFAGDGWDPRLREFIGRIDKTFWWGLYDREPLRNWTRGRVTLLGDAAHPMLPHAGQGVNQALEDSVTLAMFVGEVRNSNDIVTAFKRYTSARMQRTAIVQANSRRSGSQRDSQAEFEDLRRRDAEMRAGRDFRRSFIFDYDAAAVAQKYLTRSY